MAGSFGIGLGSFLKGVTDGANAYSSIQTAKSQQKLNDMRVKEAESNLGFLFCNLFLKLRHIYIAIRNI